MSDEAIGWILLACTALAFFGLGFGLGRMFGYHEEKAFQKSFLSINWCPTCHRPTREGAHE